MSFKVFVALAFLLVVYAARLPFTKIQFNDFIKTYNKEYATPEETERRFEIFSANLARAEAMNARSSSAKYGVTKYSDLTADEFRELYLIKNFESHRGRYASSAVEINLPENTTLPTSFDWRDHGAVTPVKNQEQCGSCWAFSATEAIESAWFLANNTLISLSPQQIVDCDVGNGDEGCDGGDTTTAYQYVMKAGGMETESDYPYVGEDESCAFNKKEVAASITNWGYVTTTLNETEMQVGLYNRGPLSICVDATSWQLYIEGVVTSNEICGTSLDHCVMITGFQNYEEIWGTYPVWNIRNSWGADWGMDGYILVERGYDICGVAMEVTLPLIH